MDVKDAVRKAKEYVIDVFADDVIADVALEEVEFDDHDEKWKITIGFSRHWSAPSLFQDLAKSVGGRPAQRAYKLVLIDDASGDVLSVKHRNLPETK